MTRIVSFGPLTAREVDTYQRLLHVESAFLTATRAGRRIGDVVQVGADSYARHGFAADEWHRHHQGGFTGHHPREFPAHPSSELSLPAGSVVAWNPSGEGWKVEDTSIVGEEGPEPLVTDASWPSIRIDGRDRPGVLVR